MLREAPVGAGRATVARIGDLVELASRVIRAEPELTACDRPACARCRDALLGGPKP